MILFTLGCIAYLAIAAVVWYHTITKGYETKSTPKEKWNDLVQLIKLDPVRAINLTFLSLFWISWAAAIMYWAWQDGRKS